jgi:hypothetical protein
MEEIHGNELLTSHNPKCNSVERILKLFEWMDEESK